MKDYIVVYPYLYYYSMFKYFDDTIIYILYKTLYILLYQTLQNYYIFIHF